MIENEDFEGNAYYFYDYGEMAEFGFFKIEKYDFSNITFRCTPKFFFGYNSNVSEVMGSNQLAGQNSIGKFKNWFIELEEIKNKHLVIKTMFEARDTIFKGPI